MSEKPDNPPAFPTKVTSDENSGPSGEYQTGKLEWQMPGMTLRDYFAAMAMQAMITKSTGQDTTGSKKGVPLVAKYAYEYADSMLAARQPEKE